MTINHMIQYLNIEYGQIIKNSVTFMYTYCIPEHKMNSTRDIARERPKHVFRLLYIMTYPGLWAFCAIIHYGSLSLGACAGFCVGKRFICYRIENKFCLKNLKSKNSAQHLNKLSG